MAITITKVHLGGTSASQPHHPTCNGRPLLCFFLFLLLIMSAGLLKAQTSWDAIKTNPGSEKEKAAPVLGLLERRGKGEGRCCKLVAYKENNIEDGGRNGCGRNACPVAFLFAFWPRAKSFVRGLCDMTAAAPPLIVLHAPCPVSSSSAKWLK